jgi:hypothetical protein
MPQVGFEPTMAVFERVKTVHALDHCDRHQKNMLLISFACHYLGSDICYEGGCGISNKIHRR